MGAEFLRPIRDDAPPASFEAMYAAAHDTAETAPDPVPVEQATPENAVSAETDAPDTLASAPALTTITRLNEASPAPLVETPVDSGPVALANARQPAHGRAPASGELAVPAIASAAASPPTLVAASVPSAPLSSSWPTPGGDGTAVPAMSSTPGVGAGATIATTTPVPAAATAPAVPGEQPNPAPGAATPGPAAPPSPGAAPRGGPVRLAPEKSSGGDVGQEMADSGSGQKNSLNNDNQSVVSVGSEVGTDVALPVGTMPATSHFAARPFRSAGATTRLVSEEGGVGAETSVAWKGWTNGGGDRMATAAQFSRLSDTTALPLASSSGGATTLAVRTSAPVAPLAPPPAAYPVSEAAVLAPVNAAIERLLLRQQDQLAVTVRFEQGGTLSLKLAMRDGAIATHFQTDVAGLEEALRSGWSAFAQDWNQRGVKLTAPTFAGGASGDDATGNPGRSFSGQEQPETAGFASRSFSTSSGRGARRASSSAPLHPAPAGSLDLGPARRGLHTWA